MQGQPTSAIQVKTSFFPLSFFLFFCNPTVEIDGQSFKAGWGTRVFPVMPGQHTVKIFFKYFFMSQCGANSATVMVPPGQTARINYFMPPLMTLPGSISEG